MHIRWSFVQGHHKDVSVTGKICSWLMNVVKEGLPQFVELRTVEEKMSCWLNVTSTNANGIYCVSKTMLNFMFIELAETNKQSG